MVPHFVIRAPLLPSLAASLSKQAEMAIKAALIDLSGTLHVEDSETPNAVRALRTLRGTGIHIKFVTNTTKESSETLYKRLCRIGFQLEQNEIYSSLSAAADYVKNNGLNPFYLVSEDALQDFPGVDHERPLNSVVVGLAPQEFHYENLNKAFNVLLASPQHPIIAIHQGKYYKRADGLALGPGCFVKGLEYAAGSDIVVIGKPNRYFFENAKPENVSLEECVMIGDDPVDDIIGAMKVGMKGIQVKTGKYRPEVVVDPPPTVLVDNFEKAVEWIIENNCPNAK